MKDEKRQVLQPYPSINALMSSHRPPFRNVRPPDEANPDAVLGGLAQNGSITERNFLAMLEVVLVTTSLIRVSAKTTGRDISMVDTRPDVGDYRSAVKVSSVPCLCECFRANW